jgi:hypothetical protein
VQLFSVFCLSEEIRHLKKWKQEVV